MAVQLSAKKLEDMARENSDDIVTPRNPFDLGPLLVNGDHEVESMTYVQEGVAKAGDASQTTLEQEAKNKKKKDEIADRAYDFDRRRKEIQDQQRDDDIQTSRENRNRPQQNSPQKLRHDNDDNDADIIVTARKPSEHKAIKTNVQLKKNFTSSVVDDAYKATSQAVEEHLGKDAKEMGGSVIRAATNTLSGDTEKAEKEVKRAMNRAGNIVEDWTDRDTRKALGSAARSTFNAVAHPVDTGVAVAKTVGNAVADTAASVGKTVLSYTPWGS